MTSFIIDEMLEAFRGKCPFLIYMKSKPARYGIKIFALVDARTYYIKNLEIYTGVQLPGPFVINNSSFHVVNRLIQPIRNTGRNITVGK